MKASSWFFSRNDESVPLLLGCLRTALNHAEGKRETDTAHNGSRAAGFDARTLGDAQ